MIDGCNRFGALCRVVLPLAAPGVAATAIFAFVASWSELLFAITFTSQTEMRTLSAGLLFMVGQYEIQWGQLSAGVIISTVPVAILFTYLQRHLIQGLSAGRRQGLRERAWLCIPRGFTDPSASGYVQGLAPNCTGSDRRPAARRASAACRRRRFHSNHRQAR